MKLRLHVFMKPPCLSDPNQDCSNLLDEIEEYFCFLMFSEGTKMKKWPEMGLKIFFARFFIHILQILLENIQR